MICFISYSCRCQPMWLNYEAELIRLYNLSCFEEQYRCWDIITLYKIYCFIHFKFIVYFSKPNIPGYQGCTLYRGQYAPAHSAPHPPNSQATTKLVHKYVDFLFYLHFTTLVILHIKSKWLHCFTSVSVAQPRNCWLKLLSGYRDLCILKLLVHVHALSLKWTWGWFKWYFFLHNLANVNIIRLTILHG